jgi:hypothetical protein
MPSGHPAPMPTHAVRLASQPSLSPPSLRALASEHSNRNQPSDSHPTYIRPVLRPHGAALAQDEYSSGRYWRRQERRTEAAQGDQEPRH